MSSMSDTSHFEKPSLNDLKWKISYISSSGWNVKRQKCQNDRSFLKWKTSYIDICFKRKTFLHRQKLLKWKFLTSTEVFMLHRQKFLKWKTFTSTEVFKMISSSSSSSSYRTPIIIIITFRSHHHHHIVIWPQHDPTTDLVSPYQPHVILPHLTSSLILNHHNFISHLNWPRPPNVSLGVYNIKYCIYIHPRSHVLTRKYDMIEELRIEYHFIYFYF